MGIELGGRNSAPFLQKAYVFTGEGPFRTKDLITLLDARQRFITVDFDLVIRDAGTNVAVVVVGRDNWDRRAIAAPLEGRQLPPRFLPQEGFVDEVLFRRDWWHNEVGELTLALQRYPGLAYAKSLAKAGPRPFDWPSTDASETNRPGADDRYRPETELFRLGYRIEGMSSVARWEALKRIVPILGLQNVAETIVSLVRTRKSQVGGSYKYRRAILEWEDDLARLKRVYYDPNSRFVWPTTTSE